MIDPRENLSSLPEPTERFIGVGAALDHLDRDLLFEMAVGSLFRRSRELEIIATGGPD